MGASKSNDDGGEKLTRRQKMAAMAKKTYFVPKPTSTIQRIDLPLEQLMPQQRIDLIADLSESILEDPSTALNSSRTEIGGGGGGGTSKGNAKEEDTTHKEPLYHKTQSKITKLLDLATLSNNGHDAHAARLALLSLLAIFQDILPSYRIRVPTEAEMSVRVSKETKATWDYERKLLQAYQRYLQLLEKTWEDGKSGLSWNVGSGKGGKNHSGRGGPPTTLAATAILALAALLQTCYNFNFRTNLLQIVVRQANNRSSEEVRSACCNSLSSMFIKDAQGDASLEAVRLMSKMVKQQFTPSSGSRGSKPIHPDVLNTWLSLPLRVHEDEAIAAKLAAAAKAKKAKKSEKDNEMLEIEKELKEGEATVDKLELARNQTDCLHAVTLTYFRILKLVVAGQEEVANTTTTTIGGKKTISEKSNASSLELLPCALRGLAKFSHLIHLDAMVDLLTVLKNLLKNVSTLPPDVAIHCILCALKTLRGPGSETLPVDPKEYLIPLYNLLPRLAFANSVEQQLNDEQDKTVDAAIQCLDYAFLQRRELSTARLAAFIKRLASTSLHCPAHLSTPLIACARQISMRYSSSSSKVDRMLENEEDIVAEGMFAPDAEDPEHSNAHATSLWELALLKYHIHPKLAEQAMGMAEGRLLKLPGEACGKILTSMSRDAQEGFIPQKAVWKKHPLDTAVSQSKDAEEFDSRRKRRQRRSQNQIRFITPRKTGAWHLLPASSYTML